MLGRTIPATDTRQYVTKKKPCELYLFVCVLLNGITSRPEYRPAVFHDNESKLKIVTKYKMRSDLKEKKKSLMCRSNLDEPLCHGRLVQSMVRTQPCNWPYMAVRFSATFPMTM